MPSPANLLAIRELEAQVLILYRHFYAGNTCTPEGKEIHVAINRIEDEIKQKTRA